MSDKGRNKRPKKTEAEPESSPRAANVRPRLKPRPRQDTTQGTSNPIPSLSPQSQAGSSEGPSPSPSDRGSGPSSVIFNPNAAQSSSNEPLPEKDTSSNPNLRPIQFVSFAGVKVTPDAEVKKAVRGHIMREVHTRRKLEKEKAKRNSSAPRFLQSREIGTDLSTAGPQEGSSSESSQGMLIARGNTGTSVAIGAKRDLDQPGALTRLKWQRSHYSSSRRSGSEEEITDIEESPGSESSGGKGKGKAKLRRWINRDAQSFAAPPMLPEFDRWQYYTAPPYALLLGDDLPALYMQPKRWPFVRRISGIRPVTSWWMPSVNIEVRRLAPRRPCLLAKAETMPWIMNSVDYLVFKGEAIKWINQRLGDPVQAVSDVTMGVIMCLASWEIARGNSVEVMQHMDGLQKIISIRGGLNNISNDRQWRFKLSLIDLLAALSLNQQPRFPALTAPQPQPPPVPSTVSIPVANPPLNIPISEEPVPASPLCGDIPLATVLANSPFNSDAIDLLQYIRDLTNHHIYGTPLPQSPFISPLFLDSSANINVDLAAPTILTTLLLAASIYIPALASLPSTTNDPNPRPNHSPISSPTSAHMRARIPFTSPHHARTTQQLAKTFESTIHDATWSQYPGILLWVLLVAVTAAEKRPERGFFYMWLMRMGTQTGWGWVEGMQVAVERFGMVRRAVEGGVVDWLAR